MKIIVYYACTYCMHILYTCTHAVYACTHTLTRVKDGQRDWGSPRGTGGPPLILIRVKDGQRDWVSPTNINQSEGWPEGLGVPH